MLKRTSTGCSVLALASSRARMRSAAACAAVRSPGGGAAGEQGLDLAQLLAQQRLGGHDRYQGASPHSGLVLTVLRIGVQRTSSSWNTPAALSGPTPSTGSNPSRSSSCWNCSSAIASWVT